MRKVLITGGAGYKGVKIAKLLLEHDFHVTVLDNFMYGPDPLVHLLEFDKFEAVKADIRNNIEGIHAYDAIIHLAGISGYPACEANPHSAQLINVDATRNLVQALAKDQLLIYASTTSFYGKSGECCDESSQVEPVSMYGITKFQAEQIIMERENSIGLRFATVFGASPKMRMDLMINDFTYKACKEGMVVLFDSYAKRTFIHVDDAAECYLFALKNCDRMKGGLFNAGGDALNYSKLEIAEAIKKYLDFKIIDSDIKDRDVRHFIISFDKITGMGFTPKKSVEDGVEELLRLYKFYDPHSHFRVI